MHPRPHYSQLSGKAEIWYCGEKSIEETITHLLLAFKPSFSYPPTPFRGSLACEVLRSSVHEQLRGQNGAFQRVCHGNGPHERFVGTIPMANAQKPSNLAPGTRAPACRCASLNQPWNPSKNEHYTHPLLAFTHTPSGPDSKADLRLLRGDPPMSATGA